MKPGDLMLPYAAWREHQQEVLLDLACRDEKYLLCEAPTGTGKSALAVGLGRLLGDKTVILTGTKQLQQQYVESLPGLVQAKGRANFACNIDPKVTAAEAVCTIGGSCARKGTTNCDYYKQKMEADAAPEAVLNYSYWLALANYTYAFSGLDLLVCDEAHSLEDEVRRFASATFRRSHFKLLGEEWPVWVRDQPKLGRVQIKAILRQHLDDGPLAPPVQRPQTWYEWAADFVYRYKGAYQATRWTMYSDKGDKWLRAMKATFENAQALADTPLDEDGWVFDDQGWGCVFRPVWVSPLVPSLVLRHAKKVLFLSATILDKDLFCHQLGIPEDQTAFVRAPSTFPKQNRPLYYDPVGRVKTSDPAVLDALVDRLDAILAKHPGERGLVHTVSYKLQQHVLAHSRHKDRMIGHDSKTKTDALDCFRQTAGAVLVSPSVATGVDLPYDLCRFQVVCKLAFPDLGDGQIKKRMKLGPDGLPDKKGQGWYNWTTACNLVQAYGRGMRAEDDNCVTYLLDGNWDWFRPAVKDMLPGWFTEAIQKVHRGGPAKSIDDVLKQTA